MPFLWVIPLALYFAHVHYLFRSSWQRYRPIAMGLLTSGWAVLSAGGMNSFLHWARVAFAAPGLHLDFVEELAFYFGTMFFSCLVCHGQLVRLRPDPRHLTGILSDDFGRRKRLGGVFVGVLCARRYSRRTSSGRSLWRPR